MILRDKCSTSYDLASIFRGRHSTLDRWSGKIAKRIGTRCCQVQKITSLRMIPTMTFIHFLTGKSSSILSDISSGIRSGILSGISSGICSGTYLLAFYLANLLAFCLAYLLAFYLTYLLAYLLAFYLTYLLAFYLTFHLAYLLAFYLAVEVRSAHWIWSSRWRSGCAHWDLDCEEEAAVRRRRRWRWRRRRRRRRRRRTALIKSNNPHLAGGEWRSLAELLRFWCCQLRKMRKSRRIASFSDRVGRQPRERWDTCSDARFQTAVMS